jgi:esterase/lipase
MIFVLVHGLNDTPVKFQTMQSAFEKQGYRCIVPSLTPKNASKRIDHMAAQLRIW